MFTGNLRGAILETLAYSDIFEFPLRLEEIHRYLPVPASLVEVRTAVSASIDGNVGHKDGYYFLPGRDRLVDVRRRRQDYSQTLMPAAIKIGHVVGSLPFVRMVALTGSLAVLNVSKDPDFDYMLVTVPGRLWTARAFALLLNRVVKKLGYTVCPNLIVSETALEWPLHDIYSARELFQMIPITGMDVYERLMKANAWAKDFLPNASRESTSALAKPLKSRFAARLQRVIELPLRSRPGKRFETWEMSRKIARFSKQAGFGEETVFTAEVCQGNFHHHRKWTKAAFESKLAGMELQYVEVAEQDARTP